MTADVLLDPPPPRPLWLWTLADLSLLLVGFFVLVQATDRRALANGLREGFGARPIAAAAPVRPAAVAPAPEPIALVSAGVGFAAGSAVPEDSSMLLDWARDNARDPRVTLRIIGSTDASTADVDPATHSAMLLAADRARAVAAYLIAHGIAADRIVIGAPGTGRRGVLVTLGFTGEPAGQALPARREPTG